LPAKDQAVCLLCLSLYLTNPVDTSPRIECDCAACEKKKALLATKEKHIYRPEVLRNYVLLAIGWGIVAYMAYTIATTKIVNTVWDPYAVLGISTSTPLDKIKSHYKKLSRTLHPDKVKLVGNLTKEVVERRFVDITKAYKAYTPSLVRELMVVLQMMRFDGIMRSMVILMENRNLVLELPYRNGL
jgi:preprotein translocase subunit Sec63